MNKTLRMSVHQITYSSRERVEKFLALSEEAKPEVLLRLSKNTQAHLLSNLHKEVILPILEHLDPDDATDLLRSLSKKKQEGLVRELSQELQQKISLLLQFDPQTAAGVMSLNYIQVEQNQPISEVADQIQKHEKRTGKYPVTLVLEDHKLKGILPIQKLIFAKPTELVKDYTRKIDTLKHTTSYDLVVRHFIDNPHKKVAVLGENDTILGVIYSDDVLRVLKENEASNLYDFAGVNNEETIYGSIKQKVRYRYKWLMINLGTAFLASFTVGLFNATISKYVLLAVYMPIVAGMGGNAATQTLAVLVRGIALKQIDLQTCLPTLRKEVAAALINGLINGVLVAAVVIFFNHDIKLAGILAFAMIANLFIAGFFGTLVPLIMTKLGKDPATSATIFITTATDVLGFLVFLGLATVILK